MSKQTLHPGLYDSSPSYKISVLFGPGCILLRINLVFFLMVYDTHFLSYHKNYKRGFKNFL